MKLYFCGQCGILLRKGKKTLVCENCGLALTDDENIVEGEFTEEAGQHLMELLG